MRIATDIADTVMIVDDEPENLRVLATLLSQQGYTVRSFPNGKAALKSVQTDPPCLILLDIRMPDMDGFEVCTQLKASAATKDIPILFLSAIDAPGEKVRAFNMGGADYIAKPFQSEEVLARIKTHLMVSRYRRELEDMNRNLKVLVEERTEDLIEANKSLRKEIEVRRSAQTALKESEERYRSIVTTANEGIVTVDPQMMITFANAAMAQLIGSDVDDIVGCHSLDFIPEEDHEDILSRFKEREEGVGEQFESRIVRRDGQIRWVQISSAPIMNINGQFQGAVLLFNDITENKYAEDSLREAQEFNKAVLNSMRAHISVLDRNGIILAVNDSWKNFARENEAASMERIGRGTNYFDVCERSARAGSVDAQVALDGIKSVIEGRIETFEFEYACHSPTQQRWFLMMAVLFKGGEGGAIVTHRDITNSKLSETELKQAYQKITELKNQIEADKIYLQEEIKLEHNFDQIIGNSDEIKYALFRLEQVSKTESAVIILGETGTGKELFARALHSTSRRSERPLIKIDCAALSEHLIESELFGHVRGAFTGANESRKGRFELAHRGTLFLDEIGELPLTLQTKLLRVLQDGEFERLGDSRTIKTDVRIITATNRDIKAFVEDGSFREDLWYRLNVFPITLPPLRDRKTDIPLLVNHFVKIIGKRVGKEIHRVPGSVMEELVVYDWPGNVRELKHVLERSVIISDSESLSLYERLIPSSKQLSSNKALSHAEMERHHILRVLEQTHWVVEGPKGAARILELHPNTLRYRMKKLGIRRPD